MPVASLKQLYIEVLSELYDCENQILKALPRLAERSSSLGLQKAFAQHLEETKTHLERLDQLFDDMGGRPKTRKCKAMSATLEQGAQILGSDMQGDLLDAAIIGVAQRVEHYEIAAYGCVRSYAALMGNGESADLLKVTLDEEKTTDNTLSKLAEQINLHAFETNQTEATGLAPGRRRKAGRA